MLSAYSNSKYAWNLTADDSLAQPDGSLFNGSLETSRLAHKQSGDSFSNYSYETESPDWYCHKEGGVPAIDFSRDFHVYGVKWDETSVVWYIDDVEVSRYEDAGGRNIADELMHVVLNLALGNDDPETYNWPGPIDAWTRSQMEQGQLKMYVDWVKTYTAD